MKYVDIAFVYEVKAREIENICLVAAALENRGYTTAFVNSCHSLTHPEMKRKFACKVVVISAGYNEDVIRFFTEHVVSYDNVVNMQWEQILMNFYLEQDETSIYNFDPFANNISHICWGEKSKKRLIEKCHLKEQQLYITGYITLDFYREEMKQFLIPKARLFKKYNLDSTKKTLLFVSSFATTNLPEAEKACFSSRRGKTADQLSLESQKQILKWFIKILSEVDNIQLVYRPHPSENDNDVLIDLANSIENFHLISSESIKHWINACDLILNWESTSAVEMYFLKKPTIMLRPIELGELYDFQIFKNAKSVSNYVEFKQSVLDEKNDCSFPLDENLLTSFYYITDKPVYSKIADVIVEKMSEKNNIYDILTQKKNDGKEATTRDLADYTQRSIKISKQIKELNSLYNRVLDYFAINSKINISNLVARRKSYNERMNVLNAHLIEANRINEYVKVLSNTDQVVKDKYLKDKYWMKLAKQNYATHKEIRKLVYKYKKVIDR